MEDQGETTISIRPVGVTSDEAVQVTVDRSSPLGDIKKVLADLFDRPEAGPMNHVGSDLTAALTFCTIRQDRHRWPVSEALLSELQLLKLIIVDHL
ncbi:gpt [Symbiodinium natans]|uniref:Gpt protein n=1 Tax=Symbiodinium natans TaxID=878477 RepID=A0A812R480_9DINO|nr:gpt [Symbiodinium natans]